jgi:calcium-translocating P-type ATPase
VTAPDLQSGDEAVRLPANRLLRDLKSAEVGLQPREAQRRLAVYGPNELPRTHEHTFLKNLVRQVTHPLALLLWLAAVLAWLARTPALSAAIIGVIVINAVVAMLQEHQAASAVAALAHYLPPRARVLRAGRIESVLATQVVPGDVLALGEGDRVCADARLISGDVQVDLSTLTGESAPVVRTAEAVPGDVHARLIDAHDAVFSGSTCTSGRAHAVVFATGAHTELGRVAILAQHGATGQSPLEREVRRVAWLIAGVAIAIGLLFLPLGLLAGLSLIDAAVFAVGLLVANVPEGLLPTITLALAVGVRSLARAGAVVKRLSAVETLGSTSVVCTDKTGTLTENRMQVSGIWRGGRMLAPTDMPLALAQVAATCNDLETSADPMERALIEAAGARGVTPTEAVAVFPFDPARKRMSVVARLDGRPTVLAKGAPETVLPLCTSWDDGTARSPLTSADRARVGAAVDELAESGLRVLALAIGDRASVPRTAAAAEAQLCLLGLVALLDPPRPEVAAAVAACHAAGMTVHVITGDNGRTAAEIARRVGVRVIRTVNGPDVDAMSDAALDHLLAQPGEIVFARSTPEAKMRIAESLQHRGAVVAMTGDGVNDAPALHRADIGIAMGRSGTDVARESATMVLTDDNFATIVKAVCEGRRAYENLRKFILYIFAHAVPEVVPFALFALSAGAFPLPLTVLQILAIDLGTETLPALALGRERAEPDLMQRRPRPRAERLINARLLRRAWLVMGAVSAALALTLFFAVLLVGGWQPGAATGAGTTLHHTWQQATSTTFAAIVACQVGTAFAARTERSSLLSIGVFTNRMLLAGIAFELTFAAALLYVPVLQRLFGTAAPPWWAIVLLIPCPLVVWGIDEFYRAVSRARVAHPRRNPSGPSPWHESTGAEPSLPKDGDRPMSAR